MWEDTAPLSIQAPQDEPQHSRVFLCLHVEINNNEPPVPPFVLVEMGWDGRWIGGGGRCVLRSASKR
jgi:hypothetical protein